MLSIEANQRFGFMSGGTDPSPRRARIDQNFGYIKNKMENSLGNLFTLREQEERLIST